MAFDRKKVQILYKKLLALYPKSFREQFGESMEQTFNDLWNERKPKAGQGLFRFVLWVFIEAAAGVVKEHLMLIKKEKNMENIIANHKSSAIISIVLVLPLVIILLIGGFEIAPFEEFLKTLTTEPNSPRNSILGLFILLGALLFLPIAAFVVVFVPIMRSVRTGSSLKARPINLLLAAALLVYITMFAGGIIVDQYPCWIGVPNCD